MGLFILDEVFQIAMQAEESGRLLYEAVAKDSADREVAGLCRHLAAQEQAHYATFETMRKALPPKASSRQFSLEEMDFVQSFVEGRVTPTEADARRTVHENSLAKVLDLAIQAELDSVAFYRQIQPEVDPSDAEAIGRIIVEEERHHRTLTEFRQSVKD